MTEKRSTTKWLQKQSRLYIMSNHKTAEMIGECIELATKKMNMKTYTTLELVDFGNYLLSKEREETLIHETNKRAVTHADLENWEAKGNVIDVEFIDPTK